jgi:hypoxanthine phosphoribosyltransferase
VKGAQIATTDRLLDLPACDALGVFLIDEAESALAASVMSPELVDLLTLRTPGGGRLSRSPLYYELTGLTDLVPQIAGGARRLLTEGQRGSATFALIETLHNVVAGAIYALWDIEIESPSRRTAAMLSQSIRWGEVLAGSLTGTVSHDELRQALDELQHRALGPGGWSRRLEGRFRELDSVPKIDDELRYLKRHVIPRLSVEYIVCPIYGATGLANALAAGLRKTDANVQLLRLGFHDLAYLGFRDQQPIDISLTVPSWMREGIEESLSSETVLVVDDNIGYGSTLRACRNLIEARGGHPVTRSVETAWELFDRVPGHKIHDVVDLPSLRPNFHHTIQTALIGHIRQRDVRSYGSACYRSSEPVVAQLARNKHRVDRQDGWSEDQLRFMTYELEHALSWDEQPVPEYRAPT